MKETFLGLPIPDKIDPPKEREYECSGCGNRFPVSEMIDVYDHEADQFFIFCKECWEKRK